MGKGGIAVPLDVLSSPPAIQTTLQPGHILYIPRGYVHQAQTHDTAPSFHATVAVPTHDWTLSHTLTHAIQKALDAVPLYRMAMDFKLGRVPFASSSTTPNTNTHNKHLLISAGEEINLQDLIDDAFRHARNQVTVHTLSHALKQKYDMHNQTNLQIRQTLINNSNSNNNDDKKEEPSSQSKANGKHHVNDCDNSCEVNHTRTTTQTNHSPMTKATAPLNHDANDNESTISSSSSLSLSSSQSRVGIMAAAIITMDTMLRGGTPKERKIAQQLDTSSSSERGLTVRAETSTILLSILKHLKNNKESMRVSEFRSFLQQQQQQKQNNHNNEDNDWSKIGLVCDLTLLSFAKSCVGFGAMAIVSDPCKN